MSITEHWPTILALTAVVAGASTQRITGMGFSLVCAPALIQWLGPRTAITLANTVGIGLNLFVMAATFRFLNWRKAMSIGIGAIAIIPPLSLLLRNASTAWLQITIGLIVVISVSAILLRRKRSMPAPDTLIARVATGVAAGAMGATASLSGPPLAMYAARTDWSAREFVPTFQMISIMISVIAISLAPPVQVSASIWVQVITAIATGAVIGNLLAPHVKSEQVRAATLVISAVGGALTALAGLRQLL